MLKTKAMARVGSKIKAKKVRLLRFILKREIRKTSGVKKNNLLASDSDSINFLMDS